MNMCQVRELLSQSSWKKLTFEKVQELEHQYGTPFYLFDSARAQDNARCLKEFLGDEAGLCYSVKANPWLAEDLAKAVDYLEVCTDGEFQLCEQLGIRGEQMIYEGPCKTEDNLRKAVREGFHRISVDSSGQLERVRRIAREEGKMGVPVLLRLFSGTQFGIETEEAGKILKRCCPELDICGIHYYRGTQRIYPQQLGRELQELMGQLLNLQELSGFFPKELELGPGLGVPYFLEDKEEDFMDSLREVKRFLAKLAAKKCHVVLEAGRCLTASAGCFVSRIEEEKRLCGKRYLFLNAGTSQMEYYGAALGRRTPRYDVLCQKTDDREEEAVICGCLCAAGDVFARAGSVPKEAGIGDYFVFYHTGAYMASENRAQFLCLDFPPLLMYNKENNMFWEKRGRISSYDLEKRKKEGDR